MIHHVFSKSNWYYYGEVYVVPGVVVRRVAVADVDGDGETEIVYNVRDPERGFRSFVRVRRADDGAIVAELEDCWCAGFARRSIPMSSASARRPPWPPREP